MISEGSRETDDAENSALSTEINYIWKYIRIENSCNILLRPRKKCFFLFSFIHIVQSTRNKW